MPEMTRQGGSVTRQGGSVLAGKEGGRSIGVDPYYLTHKAIAIGHHPEAILE